MTPEQVSAVSPNSGNARGRGYPANRTALLFAALPLLLLASLWPSAQSLWALWIEEGKDSHALLVLGMCVLACAWSTSRGDWEDARPSLLGWLAISVVAVAWILAVLLQISTVYNGLVSIFLICVVWSASGAAIARRFMVPALLMVCALPVWDPVAAVLQLLSVKASGAILGVIGVPTILDGVYVRIPSGTFKVELGCSGISFFQTGIALGLFLGAKERLPTSLTMIVTLFLAMVAIATNWIRIVAIVLAGHMTNMKHTLVVDGHYWFGWSLFTVAMLIATWLAVRRLPAPHVEEGPSASDAKEYGPQPQSALWAMAALLLMALVSALTQSGALEPRGSIFSIHWPSTIGSYQLNHQLPPDGWSPNYPGAATQSTASYRGEKGTFTAYSACYARQGRAAELVGYYSSVAGPDLDVESKTSLDDSRFSEILWRSVAGSRWVGAQVYRVGSTSTGSKLVAKLASVALMTGEPKPSCTLVVAARCDADCEGVQSTAVGLAGGLVDGGLFDRP